MTTTFGVFEEQDTGILNVIRAADLYAVHVLASIRGREPSPELLAKIISGSAVSSLAVHGQSYSAGESELLRQRGHLRQIGQQILVATYTAIESYLTHKFVDYLRFKLGSANQALIDMTLEILKSHVGRSLDDARKMYRKFLDIDIRWFEVPMIYTTDGRASEPSDSWDALQLISVARNEIVHVGTSTRYAIGPLTDAWYPFEFARRWVSLFECQL
jgi:hypothetical protein